MVQQSFWRCQEVEADTRVLLVANQCSGLTLASVYFRLQLGQEQTAQTQRTLYVACQSGNLQMCCL